MYFSEKAEANERAADLHCTQKAKPQCKPATSWRYK
jgi:hypothetical protein